jgi:hypothetical protein
VFKSSPDGPQGYAEAGRAVDVGFLAQLIAWIDWVHEDVVVTVEGR